MSGASENKWRRGAPSTPSPSNSSGQQQRQSSGSLRAGDISNQKSGAWGQNKARNTGSGPHSPRTGPTSGGPSVANQVASKTSEAPAANSFNAAEIKDFMKKQYREAIATSGGDESAIKYKPSAESGATKPAWGTRPNAMANGRDFWVELAKQIKALEESQKKSK